MKPWIAVGAILFFLVGGFSGVAQAQAGSFFEIEALQNEFEWDHRTFEKVLEGKSAWESVFCPGTSSYRVELRTQVQALDLQVEPDGAVVLQAVLKDPSVRLQGSYQGAYSFCYPLSQGLTLGAETITLEGRVQFTDSPEGPVVLQVQVHALAMKNLKSDALSPQQEQLLNNLFNKSLEQVWASELGEWFNQWLSDILNKNIPKPL